MSLINDQRGKILEKAKSILSKEPKLIELKKAKRVIFVGDTHGDWEASKKVIKDYLKPGNKIVFLGDYVDRGPYSKENLDFLLETKIKHPKQIYLLQGNHEGHHISKFYPADFWERLDKKSYKMYSSVVEHFSLVATTKEIIALHGGLPEVEKLTDINKIKIGDEKWRQICWGDFVEGKGEYLGQDPFTGRPKFGKNWFLKLIRRFKKKILIRAHQPDCPQFVFNNKCLTIFTSSAYGRERVIAIANLEKEIKDARDLEIVRI